MAEAIRQPSSRPHPAVLAGALVLAVAAISTAAILVRLSDGPSAGVIAFYRLAFATALLLPVAMAIPRVRSELAAIGARRWTALAIVGAVLAGHFVAWFESLSMTTVASSVVLVTLHPVFVGIASHWLFGEGLRRLGWVGVGLAFVGGVVIVIGDRQRGTESFVGDLLALAGAVAMAGYFLAGRRLRRDLSLLAYVVPVYSGATAVLLVAVLLTGEPLTGWPWKEYALFAAMAVFPMVIGHTILNFALRFITAPTIATTILGEPVGSTALAVVILGELPPLSAILGGAVVLAGIAIVAYQEQQARAN